MDLERRAQIASRVPVVVGAEYDDEMRGIGDLADASPVAEIIETLATQGHRSFLHIAGDRTHTTVRSREQAFLETINRLGLESAGVVGGGWLAETGRRGQETGSAVHGSAPRGDEGRTGTVFLCSCRNCRLAQEHMPGADS